MDDNAAALILDALSHPTRLRAFRLLSRNEPDGLSTGALVEASGLTQSTFSTHLAVLAKAGLTRADKRGRQQIQHARLDTLRALMTFLEMECGWRRSDDAEPERQRG